VWFRVATGAVLALALHPAFADSARGRQGFAADRLPRSDIVAIVRSAGLVTTAPPVRYGPNYLVDAKTRYGTPVRVVVDARLGDIVSFRYVMGGPAARRRSLPPYAKGDFPPPPRTSIGGPPVRYAEFAPPYDGPYDALPYAAYAPPPPYMAYGPPPPDEVYGPPPPYEVYGPPSPYGQYGPRYPYGAHEPTPRYPGYGPPLRYTEYGPAPPTGPGAMTSEGHAAALSRREKSVVTPMPDSGHPPRAGLTAAVTPIPRPRPENATLPEQPGEKPAETNQTTPSAPTEPPSGSKTMPSQPAFPPMAPLE
jgi:hypothetical protein